MAPLAAVAGGAGLATPRLVTAALALQDDRGHPLPFEPARWHRPASAGERQFLAGVAGPVLDVGCGPGRVLDALARRRVAVLGVDPSPTAAAIARRRGGAVLQRSVFDALPGTGRWETVLLLDGNIGIGGLPRRLLRRCAELVRPGGTVIVEVEPPGAGWRACQARVERDGETGPWFPWAVVGRDAIAGLAAAACLAVRATTVVEDRWLVALGHATAGTQACA
ncbi:MAG: class I SAM-dependent methyltransferase [Acidimicrobiia bacterium]|nr:class I SAM-dependent methyltransferase [Acidimicrobiia bacterium]